MIFDFRFFHESVCPGPLSILLRPFQFFRKIEGGICNLPPQSLLSVVKGRQSANKLKIGNLQVCGLK
jgi:hypothetical protein